MSEIRELLKTSDERKDFSTILEGGNRDNKNIRRMPFGIKNSGATYQIFKMFKSKHFYLSKRISE